jgi:hypothetical protein
MSLNLVPYARSFQDCRPKWGHPAEVAETNPQWQRDIVCERRPSRDPGNDRYAAHIDGIPPSPEAGDGLCAGAANVKEGREFRM